MPRLEAGVKAPAFSLLDQDEKKVALKDLKGKQVVVYFYPADDTPGCTKEACQFNENLTTFNRAGIAVLGISPDGAVKHQKFRKKYGLKFPLLSGEKTLYGRKSMGVIRSTFLVDEKGVIVRAWYNVRADGHAAKVLEEAKSQY